MKFKVITGKWEKRFMIYAYLWAGVILAVILSGFMIYKTALDRVVLEVDTAHYEWKTLSPTVADVLAEKGVVLKKGDVVIPDLTTKIKEDSKIRIVRAFPVQIKTGGQTKEYYTITQTVKDLLAQAGINCQPEDRILPGPDLLVRPGQTIKVIKVTTTVVTKETVINPPVEYRKEKTLERGVQQVIKAGTSGLAQRQVKVVYEDGREVRRYVIAEKIIKPAAKAIIALGIKPVVRTLETSRGSIRYVEQKLMTATAYYPGPESCGKYAVYGETYTGKKAGFGIVAVDPRVIPLGTKLYIEGYGRAEAADIGGAIKGNKIDLCFETFREAAMYGLKRNVKVYILE